MSLDSCQTAGQSVETTAAASWYHTSRPAFMAQPASGWPGWRCSTSTFSMVGQSCTPSSTVCFSGRNFPRR